MSYSSWLRLLARIFKIDRNRRIPDNCRLRVEQLEDRWVPSTTVATQPAVFVEGDATTSSQLATFTDSTPHASTDYTVNVAWGDPSPDSAGVVSFDGAVYHVNAS